MDAVADDEAEARSARSKQWPSGMRVPLDDGVSEPESDEVEDDLTQSWFASACEWWKRSRRRSRKTSMYVELTM
jgi:hypothetical protein